MTAAPAAVSRLLALTASVALAACGGAAPDPAEVARDEAVNRKLYVESECRTVILDKLTSPKTADWGETEMRDLEGSHVLRGDVTSMNGRGVPITHRYVCVLSEEKGKVASFFRSSSREMYDELVRLAGFDS